MTICLAVSKMAPEGILGVLKQADPTYSSTDDYGFRAQNADRYFVDLFCPDIDPVPTEAGNWLAEAPKIDALVIGQDGMPAHMVCVDPRNFALHKLWLSKQKGRQPKSRLRDAEQARAVAAVATRYLNLNFDKRLLKRLPAEVGAGVEVLKSASVD